MKLNLKKLEVGKKNIGYVTEFLGKANISWWALFIPAALALGASLLEGATMGLLVPLIKGALNQDLSHVMSLPVLGSLIQKLPDSITSSDVALCFVLLSLFFLASIVGTIINYLSQLTAAFQTLRFASTLRGLIFERYMSFGKLFFDKNNLGYLYQVLVTHSTSISGSLMAFQKAFYSFCTLGIYLGIMIYLSWKLFLFVLLAFPVLHFSMQFLVKKMKASSINATKVSNELGMNITNALSSINLIKAYSQEKMSLPNSLTHAISYSTISTV